MILYTPLSQSDVFPHSDEDFVKREYVSFEGRTLCVEQTDNGTYELVQLMSTDPQDFLNTSYTPGSIIP